MVVYRLRINIQDGNCRTGRIRRSERGGLVTLSALQGSGGCPFTFHPHMYIYHTKILVTHQHPSNPCLTSQKHLRNAKKLSRLNLISYSEGPFASRRVRRRQTQTPMGTHDVKSRIVICNWSLEHPHRCDTFSKWSNSSTIMSKNPTPVWPFCNFTPLLHTFAEQISSAK